uniref:Uncharacterized protein n=1 Tax=Roseihalotalea indica TaxID=2867963 RepID=A0AA49JEG9_9BACT|nr:hypothetical protein K4G66_05175 [Tunicatimonas sp. TK19036]
MKKYFVMLLIWVGICLLAFLGQPADTTTENSPIAAMNEAKTIPALPHEKIIDVPVLLEKGSQQAAQERWFE